MDRLLIYIQLLLASLGILGVATSEPELWQAHALRLAAAFILTIVIARFSAQNIVKASPYAYLLILAALVAVPIIGVSPAGSESQRWIALGGFTVQPSELMKVAVIAYLTAFFHNHLGDWHIWRPMLVIGFAAGLIVIQPDISTAAFIFLLSFAMMVAAGTTLTRLVSISTAALLLTVLVAGPYLSQFAYPLERIQSWRDLRGDQLLVEDEGYQASRAQRTVAEAGIFGVGSGRPIYVPEAETDMVAVAIAQALGFLGIATLITLYLMLALRGLDIAARVRGPASLLAAGATIYICAQAALNLMVTSGLFPVTGIPLPFVSYGMNSLISVAVAMGFIHIAYRQSVAQETS